MKPATWWVPVQWGIGAFKWLIDKDIKLNITCILSFTCINEQWFSLLLLHKYWNVKLFLRRHWIKIECVQGFRFPAFPSGMQSLSFVTGYPRSTQCEICLELNKSVMVHSLITKATSLTNGYNCFLNVTKEFARCPYIQSFLIQLLALNDVKHQSKGSSLFVLVLAFPQWQWTLIFKFESTSRGTYCFCENLE